MFGTSRPGAAAYRQVSVDSDALAASPHQLVLMLYDGALQAIAAARTQLQGGDIEGKGKSIARAIEIVGSGLAASLDKTVGGEIAANLASLYDYIVRLLVGANIANDERKLEEAATLLGQMRDTWIAIGPLGHLGKPATGVPA